MLGSGILSSNRSDYLIVLTLIFLLTCALPAKGMEIRQGHGSVFRAFPSWLPQGFSRDGMDVGTRILQEEAGLGKCMNPLYTLRSCALL